MKYPSICFDRFKMPGFEIANADLCLSEDMSKYRFFLSEGKKYFSFPEIKGFIDHLNSCCPIYGHYLDIPTDEEFEQIIKEFGYRDGNRSSFHLASALGLGFYGSIGILTTLEEYNKTPQNFVFSQAIGYGVTGNYWCRGTGKHKGQAGALSLGSNDEIILCRSFADGGANVGYSVRLIARPW